ncbi:GTP-binding protein EngB like [Verticillium longisporum]|uniref:GTP-binding protein EngB like n=1 Tax=Verticillium longisporum TaxID=100787 RepID=A0A8I3AHY3_VERLO|nr:GTP-binding protein EngB like [Verticillium longisporum]
MGYHKRASNTQLFHVKSQAPAEQVPSRVEPEEAPKADTSSTPPKQPRPRRIPPQLTQPHDIWRAHSIHLELPPDASTIPVDEASGPPESYFSKTPTKPKAPPAPGTLTFEPTPTPTHALASKLLTTPTPTFLHASSHLRNTRANSALPEIAIIGASNCGKSTFLNAVAHRAHLARTSARAGHTTTMNTYGLGPAPPPAAQARARARLGPGERPPRHALAVVDTPGYGFGSRTAWGDGILGYLARRTLLRGVVVLLPADKEGLAQRDAELVRAYRGPEADGDLHGACRGEKGTLVPRVYLTAAAMERREAIMEMAGVGELLAPNGKKQAAKHDVYSLEDVPAEKRSETRDPEAWGGETISFEDLEKMYRKK